MISSKGKLIDSGSLRPIDKVLPLNDSDYSFGATEIKVYRQSVLHAESIPLTVTMTLGLSE